MVQRSTVALPKFMIPLPLLPVLPLIVQLLT
jgi:hypothetical protein